MLEKQNSPGWKDLKRPSGPIFHGKESLAEKRGLKSNVIRNQIISCPHPYIAAYLSTIKNVEDINKNTANHFFIYLMIIPLIYSWWYTFIQ